MPDLMPVRIIPCKTGIPELAGIAAYPYSTASVYHQNFVFATVILYKAVSGR